MEDYTPAEDAQLVQDLWKGHKKPNEPINPGLLPGNAPENDYDYRLDQIWTMAERM